MELFSTPWGVISAAIVFCLGGGIAHIVGQRFRIPSTRSLLLYAWHTLFCCVYMWYVSTAGGDAIMYFRAGVAGGAEFSLGTSAVKYLSQALVQGFGLSFAAANLFFNIFGTIGFLAFYAALQDATADRSRAIRWFALLIIFLPSVSFWTSALGKDSIAFMATGLALWAALALKRRAWFMVAAIASMLVVRPHMAALMVMAVATSMMVQPRVSISQRAFLGGVALAVAAMMVPLAADYSGLGSDAGVADLAEYIETRQGYNMSGGGGVDISSMSLPLQLLTYLFRPLPFEAHSIPALAASVDNVMLLALILVGGWSMIKGRRPVVQANRAFMWVYALSAWMILALTTANLGISVRQKWMFVPMLLFLFISVTGRVRARTQRSADRGIPGGVLVQSVRDMGRLGRKSCW